MLLLTSLDERASFHQEVSCQSSLGLTLRLTLRLADVEDLEYVPCGSTRGSSAYSFNSETKFSNCYLEVDDKNRCSKESPRVSAQPPSTTASSS
jgi:hypothetical protein